MDLSLLLAASDPKAHVLPHGLFRISHSNIPAPFGKPVDEFWFTNHLLMLLVSVLLLVAVFVPMGRYYGAQLAGGQVVLAPARGFRGLMEAFLDALRGAVVKPVLGEDTDRFMPFLWALFFFILFNNLLGMVPIEPIANLLGLAHIGGTATGNINITAGLAIVAFIMIHVSGMKQVFGQLVSGTFGVHGHDEGHDESAHAHDAHHHDAHAHESERKSPGAALLLSPVMYLWNFAPHVFAPQGVRRPSASLRVVMMAVYAVLIGAEYWGIGRLIGGTSEVAAVTMWIGAAFGVLYAFGSGGLRPLDWADSLMWGFLLILEFIGALVKPFALCMRLFANMIAGHMVLASILALIPAFQGISAAYLGMSLPIVIGCALLSFLELFVAFLQAYIFMYLTTMFIGFAVHPEH